MSAHEADDLADLIARIVKDMKCGVLLIEHNISLVLKICEHIHVLDSGELIDEGDPAHIKTSEKVLHAYMGTQGDVDMQGAIL
jgi:branched-chain amino acid transport system ATP-binding protein